MKNLLLPAVALALLGTFTAIAPLQAADDTTRRAQQALRDGGFYYGPIDGAPGDETTQAIRRYQIRNGLAVSGQLNAETLRNLGINATPPPSAPAGGSPGSRSQQRPEPTPPPLSTPAPSVPPRTITGRPPGSSLPPTPAPRYSPPPPTTSNNRPDLRIAPLPPGAQVPSVPLTGFFSRTPYEFAPPAVQADVLRRAQRALAQGGFYDGPADGQPGRRTVEALGEFQGAFGLTRTRRLDGSTLRVLRLLPNAGSNLPEPLSPGGRRGGGPPDRDEEDDDNGPALRVRPRRGGEPEVYQGRIIR